MSFVTIGGQKFHGSLVNTDEFVAAGLLMTQGGVLIPKAVGAAYSGNPEGLPLVAVRDDAGDGLAGTDDGEFGMPTMDGSNRLYVNAAGVTQPVQVLGGELAVSSHHTTRLATHPSAAETSTVAGGYEITNEFYRGAIISLKVTAGAAVTMPIDFHDLGLAEWFNVYTGTLSCASGDQKHYYIYPNVTPTAASSGVRTWDVVIPYALPRVFRLVPTHAASSTYELGVQLLL
jgi:hypothetical protein